MRSIRMLAAAILTVTGLVAVGATTESANAASSKDLLVSRSSVMKYEKFEAYGRVSTQDARKVKIQYRTRTDDPWTTKTTLDSNSNGYFSAIVATSKTRYWRYYAPASGGHASIKGYSKKITVVPQKVQSITIHNAVQCYAYPAEITVLVDFYPARWGREVVLHTSDGDFVGYEDRSGVAKLEFTPPDNNAIGTFNARAEASTAYGAPSFSSVTLHYSRADSLCL